jgi:hypothetical protein
VRRSLAAVLLLAALAGCGGDGSDGADGADGAALEAGATRLHRVEAADFSLRLPSDWRDVSGPEALATELEAFGEENPEIEGYLRTVVENDLIEFFAFDPDVEGGFATNVNLIRFRIDGTPSFDEWSEGVVAEAEALPTRVGDVEHTREELPAGDALRIEYENEFETDAGETTVATLQYVLVADGRGYVVTFSTVPAQVDDYDRVFRAAAESFRVD